MFARIPLSFWRPKERWLQAALKFTQPICTLFFHYCLFVLSAGWSQSSFTCNHAHLKCSATISANIGKPSKPQVNEMQKCAHSWHAVRPADFINYFFFDSLLSFISPQHFHSIDLHNSSFRFNSLQVMRNFQRNNCTRSHRYIEKLFRTFSLLFLYFLLPTFRKYRRGMKTQWKSRNGIF